MASSGESARDLWKVFRRSADGMALAGELSVAAGSRQRCVYCRDSRAADIDHHLPISKFRSLTFDIRNLMWVCPECNRTKNARYEHDGARILNPYRDRVESHFVFDCSTGILLPRMISAIDTDPRAVATEKVLPAINYEAVTEGRVREARSLGQLLRSCMTDVSMFKYFYGELLLSDFGVARWLVRRSLDCGSLWEEFRQERPAHWRRAAALLT